MEYGVRSTKNAQNVIQKPRLTRKTRAASLFMVVTALSLMPFTSLAQPMTTPNYRLDPNVANSFGGLSETGNYSLVDSGGEAAIGIGNSGSYKLSSGYISQLEQAIELNVLPVGLMAYWPLNTGLGIQAYDVTTNNNQGVLTNSPVWSTGKVGANALEFDGADAGSYVAVPDSANLSITGSITISTWVYKTANPPAGEFAVLAKKRSGTSDSYQLLIDENGQAFFTIDTGSPVDITSGVLADNTWHHVLANWSGSEMKLYINGKEVASASQSGSMADTVDELKVGGYGASSPTFQSLSGKLDEVKIYDRALSPDEVKDEYDASNSGIANALTLPQVSPAASQAVNAEVIVITDAGGYDLSIEQTKDLTRLNGTETIPAIAGSISNPAPWNEGSTTGFGFTVTDGVQVDSKWGTSPDFEYAAVPATATTFHSRVGLTGGGKEVTKLRFRLGVDGSQAAGIYRNRIGLTATLKP